MTAVMTEILRIQGRGKIVAIGEMADRVRAFDWAATPMGSLETWSDRLCGAIEAMLAAPQLASLAVGPDRVFLYNDEASRHYGRRHPDVLGLPLSQAFPHEFKKVETFYDRVLAGESLHVPAQPLDPAQTGRPEVFDAYLTPIRGEAGEVIAVHMTGIAVGDRQHAEAKLRESEARQALLLRLSDALRTISDPAEIRRTAMRLLGEQLGLARIYYFDVERDADGSWAHVIERGHQRDPAQMIFEGRYSLSHFGSSMFEGFAQGEVIAVADTETHPGLNEDERAAYRAVGVTAFINVPLLHHGEYAAGIGAHDIAPHTWSDAEIDLIREVAARVWIAAERRLAEDALRESEKKYRSLFESIDEGFCTVEVLFDAEGRAVDYRFLETNAAFERQTGLTDAVGARMRDLAPEHEQHWFDTYGRIALTGRPERFEQQAQALGHWYDVYAFRTAEPYEHRVGILFKDITDRKRNEAALRDSRQRFQALVTAGTHSVYRMSPDWRIMYQLDSETLDTTTDPVENWVDKYIPEGDRPAVDAAIEQAIGTKSLFELEHSVRLADGGIGWVLSRAVPLFGADGEIVEWFGAGSDVTARRTAAEQLRDREDEYRIGLERLVSARTAELKASRDLLRGTMDASTDMIQVFEAVRDRSGEIIDFIWVLNNRTSESKYGEVRGESLLKRNPGVILEGIFEAFKRVSETGIPEQAERHYVHEQFAGWFYQSIVKLGDGVATTTKSIDDWKAAQADILRLQAAAAEVKLNESEDRFRTLADTAPAMIWQNDEAGGNLFVNQYFLDYTGKSQDELRGMQWQSLVHPDHVEAYVATYMKAVRDQSSWQNRNRIRRHDGAWHWFNNVAQPLLGHDGRYLGHVGVSTDIQAAVDAEAALRESAERQAFLLALGDRMRAERHADAIIAAAIGMLGERLHASRIVFADIDEAAGVARIRPGWTAAGALIHPAELRLDDFGGPLLDDLRAGRAVRYDDVGEPPFARDDLAALHAIGVKAGLSIPLVLGGRLVMNLNVHQHVPRRWADNEVTLVEEIAERLWGAVERARAEAALRESEETLAADLANAELLRGLAERLVTEENVETIYDEILSAALTIAQADAGSVQIYDPDTKALGLLTAQNFTPTITDRFWTVDASSRTACGVALETGQRAFVDFADEAEDAGCLLLVDKGFRTALAIPLVSRTGGQLGMLNTHWRAAGHRSTERQLRFLDLIARQTADLMEQRQAQRVLRESEERLRQFGEASHDILWIRDAATLQWVYLTPAFETIYGLSREEALTGDDYRNWQDVIVPEDRDHAAASIARVGAGERVTFEYRVQRPSDGTIRWLRDTDFPITDQAGRVVLIGGIGHDFTDVREAELRLQTLVEGMPQLVWRAVEGGEWTWASPQWTDYTGQEGADYRGFGWQKAVHPDDRADAREAWSHAVEQGGFDVEYRIRRNDDGQYRWFQTRAAPVRDHAGTIIEWLGTSTDVHDLRELQELQKVLVAELQHRTRNLIGVVRSMADKTARASGDLPDFRARFRDRLEALARVQGLLSRMADHDRVTFDELIDTELAAMDGSAERVTVDGPSGVRLRSSTVQTLAMALHELATNAMKYGALGQASGRLAITWWLGPSAEDRRPWLHIDWRESGVEMPPSDAAPRGTGQGRELIERALPYQLSAKTSYNLGPEGAHCTISIPVSASTIEVGEYA